MKIIDLIIKRNPNATAGQAALAYKVLKELEYTTLQKKDENEKI